MIFFISLYLSVDIHQFLVICSDISSLHQYLPLFLYLHCFLFHFPIAFSFSFAIVHTLSLFPSLTLSLPTFSISLCIPSPSTSPSRPPLPFFQTRGNERGVLIHGSRDNITAVKPRLSPKPRAPDSRPLYGCHTALASRTISGGVEAASS